MKTKIALAVAFGALFVAVPSTRASVTLSVVCNTENPDGTDDTCTISATGVDSHLLYKIDIIDICSNVTIYSSDVDPSQLEAGSVHNVLDATTSSGCTAGWTFNLYALSGHNLDKKTLVATQVVFD